MSGGSWQEFVGDNLGKLIGGGVGLILGWMVIQYGLFETLFVLIMVVGGYLLGKRLDDGETLNSIIDRIFKR
ncbi:MAG TPA: DUF2273 domain-containing protein [Desulfobacteria bacterium]|nr:DUF2273 domain-containing protein [Desulfobacteria bacterium]